MKAGQLLATALLFAAGQLPAQQRVPPDGHEGRWSVVLACDDVKDKNGLVKGYEFSFHADIKDGRLKGQYGSVGAPNSITYEGTVQPDGTLEIEATGITGKSEFSVGKVAQGTPYKYTMNGSLGLNSGRAVRRESRPCIATFSRQR
jgi:hypothetical protein